MTKEEYLKKLKVNKEKQEREWGENYRINQEKYANQVIENVTNLIESAYTQQVYVLSQEERNWLFRNYLFEKKLEDLRKKYNFLEIYTNTNKCYGLSFETRVVRWNVKGE